MRVLLLYPPDSSLLTEGFFVHRSPPLGLAYIAAALEETGHDVKVIDCVIENYKQTTLEGDHYQIGLSWDEIEERIQRIKPDLVGLSCLFTSQFQNLKKTAALIKKIDPTIKTVAGGAHPSSAPYEVMADTNLDYIVIGEGEHTMLSLVRSLEDGSELDKIDGLVCRKEGLVKVNPKKSFITNLDSLSFPARHLFPMNKYLELTKDHRMDGIFTERSPYTAMITSRGCPNRCAFCAIHRIWGGFWRARSSKNVVDEIELLVEKYGVKEIHFEDDNLTLDKNRMHDICDEILRRGLDIRWATPNGVHINTLDEALLRKMKRAGCYSLFLGIESGNQNVLNQLIKKGISLERVSEIVRCIRRVGINVNGFFVLGFPGETRETIEDTIKFAKSLDLDSAIFSIATPYPGTELYDQCTSKGYLDGNSLEKVKIAYANITTELLSAEEVEQLRDKAVREFQRNRILKHPTRLLRPRELVRVVKYVARNVSK
jgi:magnesium-protoporphyrin IX monomethyl ester (oxidative) cyclase